MCSVYLFNKLTEVRKKKISPAAINALKDALTSIYWYKSDLRSFLTHCLSEPTLLSRLNWDDYKREIVSNLVDFLSRNEDRYQGDLLRLITETTRIEDFSHLERLEDGADKAARAQKAVEALEEHAEGYQELVDEEKQIEERREKARKERLQRKAIRNRLAEFGHNTLIC